MENVQAVIAEGQRLQSTYVGITADAFTRAAYDIKSGISTLTDEGVAAMTSSALTVAKATKGIPENMTSFFATSYGIFKKQFSEMSDADWGDMFGAALSASVQRFKTDGTKMQQTIESAGAGATNLGMQMTEQMTLLGMMQQQMQAGEAGTALRAFATNVARAHEAFGKMKVTTERPVRVRVLDENGQLREMPDILADLKARYGETQDAFEAAEIKEAFGTDEAMKMINALDGQEEAVRANAEALRDAAREGAAFTESMAANVDDYDRADWERFIQQIDVMKQKIGAGLLPAMDKLVPILSRAATAIGNFASEHPGFVAGLGAAIVGVAGLATVAAPLLFIASSLVTTFAALRTGSLVLGAVLRGTSGWVGLVTRGLGGLKGPELKYETEGGFIAHNRALRHMVDMAERARGLARGLGGEGIFKGGVAAAGIGAMASAATAARMGGMEAFERLVGQIGGSKAVTIHQSPTYHIDLAEAGGDMEGRLRAILEEHDREMRLEQERLLND